MLTLWVLAAVAGALATAWPQLLSLDPAAVLVGEWWRLASGHLVHLTWRHWLFDLVALGGALAACYRLELDRSSAVGTMLAAAGAVSLVLLVLQPVAVYGGLSGVTAGLLALVALEMLRAPSPWRGGMLLFVLSVKLASEHAGVAVAAVPPVWQAHWAGAAAGAACALYARSRASCRIACQ